MEGVNITLVCWACGAKKYLDVNRAPQFAFEVADLANKAGMKGVVDLNYNRSLVFCDDECHKSQLKKDGTLRARPKLFVKQPTPPGAKTG